MYKYLLKFKFTLLILILVLGFSLRNHNLYTWPRLGATFDEYAWTWQGISLITNKIPTSWSYHPQYKNKKLIVYQKTNFIMVTPYLEHPPVFGLVAGSFALLNGVKGMYDVDLIHIRPLALLLGVSSIFLIFLLARDFLDQKTALVAALLYATIPTITIGSRIVQNENFFIPLWLFSLFLISRFLKTKKAKYRNASAVICGLLILAKIPWIAGSLSLILILLFFKKNKDVLKFIFVIIPIVFLYFVYGFYFDKDVFLGLWQLQLNRYDMGFTSIFALFQKPYLADRFYLDGWIYFGWFSLIILMIKDLKKNIFIIVPAISYFLIFLAGIPDEPGHGWYRYPFYPFLVLSLAVFIKEYFAKNWSLTFIFLVFIGTSLFQLTWNVAFGFSYIVFRSIIILWGITLFPQFFSNKLIAKGGKILAYSWFVIFIILNIWSITIYNEQ